MGFGFTPLTYIEGCYRKLPCGIYLSCCETNLHCPVVCTHSLSALLLLQIRQTTRAPFFTLTAGAFRSRLCGSGLGSALPLGVDLTVTFPSIPRLFCLPTGQILFLPWVSVSLLWNKGRHQQFKCIFLALCWQQELCMVTDSKSSQLSSYISLFYKIFYDP